MLLQRFARLGLPVGESPAPPNCISRRATVSGRVQPVDDDAIDPAMGKRRDRHACEGRKPVITGTMSCGSSALPVIVA